MNILLVGSDLPILINEVKIIKSIRETVEITNNFLEMIFSNGFDKESLEILKRKKNLRIIDISKFKYKNQMSIKSFDGSFLIQYKNNKMVKI